MSSKSLDYQSKPTRHWSVGLTYRLEENTGTAYQTNYDCAIQH